MSESSMVKTLVQKMSPELDAVRIESPRTGVGIPDINFKWGWIECKAMALWPKGAEHNPVIFPHKLSTSQQVWLYRREKMGGVALVCGKISNMWMFWSGQKIKELGLWDSMTRPEMIRHAEMICSPLDKQKLISFLRDYAKKKMAL